MRGRSLPGQSLLIWEHGSGPAKSSKTKQKARPSSTYRASPGSAAGDAPPAPPLFLPPHLSHLSQHLNHLSQPFFPLKGWGAPCPCCPKEEARSTSVAELRRKAHEHSAALFHSLASFQTRALLPLPLHLPPLPLNLMPHDAPPPPTSESSKHLD
ncbi:hypothetical protein MSG28_013050 [Choristoneura fumiferana]|uniref:Uncharacterized protein n=1 Tax=Choristoneura fumiferana TaxID=7141 RepID=A0ACC0KRQ4_CHOFU|nr:hypothetical protein MSG28_013050 [Choristoneura fumiferana]